MIWTMKLLKRSEKSEAQKEMIQKRVHIFQQMLPQFGNVQIKWLMSNLNERTVMAIKME